MFTSLKIISAAKAEKSSDDKMLEKMAGTILDKFIKKINRSDLYVFKNIKEAIAHYDRLMQALPSHYNKAIKMFFYHFSKKQLQDLIAVLQYLLSSEDLIPGNDYISIKFSGLEHIFSLELLWDILRQLTVINIPQEKRTKAFEMISRGNTDKITRSRLEYCEYILAPLKKDEAAKGKISACLPLSPLEPAREYLTKNNIEHKKISIHEDITDEKWGKVKKASTKDALPGLCLVRTERRICIDHFVVETKNKSKKNELHKLNKLIIFTASHKPNFNKKGPWNGYIDYPQTIQDIPCAKGWIFIQANGRLDNVQLEKDTILPAGKHKIKCLAPLEEHSYSRLKFHNNGSIKETMLAEPHVLYVGKKRITFYKGDILKFTRSGELSEIFFYSDQIISGMNVHHQWMKVKNGRLVKQ